MSGEQADTAPYTEAELKAVQAKLHAFGATLTPGERAAFVALLDGVIPPPAGETDEVAGYCGPTFMSADTGTSYSNPTFAALGSFWNGLKLSLWSDPVPPSPSGPPEAGVILARFRDQAAH